jgi:hypothetical protein
MSDSNKRPVQYFTAEYLELCKSMTPDQIIEFLDNYRILMGSSLPNHPQASQTPKKQKK